MTARKLTNALLIILVVLLAVVAIGMFRDYEEVSDAPPAEPPLISAEEGYLPPLGSNEIFREATSAAAGHELIMADLRLPGGAVGEAHSHPREEYLYVLAGSAVLDIEGMEQRTLSAGEHFVIPPETVHTPRAGPEGIRAIIARVHDEGDPLSIPAGQ